MENLPVVKKTISMEQRLAGAVANYAAATGASFSGAVSELCKIGLAWRPEAPYTDVAKEMTGAEIVERISLAIREAEASMEEAVSSLASGEGW